MSVRKNTIPIDIAVVAAYVMIFFILTFPLLLHFDRAFLGSFGGYRDLPSDIWMHWFVSSSIKAGTSFFYTQLTHYPVGFSLIDHVSGFLIPVFSALLSFFVNLPASYNLSACFFMVFSAFTGYLLVLYLVKDRAAAFLGGFLFGFNPFTLNEVFFGRLAAAFGGGVALFALLLFTMAHGQKRNYVLWASFTLILTSLTSMYYGMFLVFFAGLFILFYGIGYNSLKIRWNLIKCISTVFLIYFIFVFVFYNRNIFFIQRHAFSLTDLPAPVRLEDFQELKVRAAQSLSISWPYTNLNAFPDVIRRFSLLMLGMAGIPVLFSFKKARFWFFSALFFYILCLGPFLKVSGTLVQVKGALVPLPYFLLNCFFPFFARVHWPDRFLMFCMLSCAVLSGMGFLWLIEKIKAGTHMKRALVCVFIGLSMLETALVPLAKIFPAALSSPAVPEFYQQLAREKGDFAVIQFPLGDTMYLYYQTIHHKKIFDGQYNLVSRFPQSYLEFVKSNSFLSALQASGDRAPVVSGIKKEDLARLKEMGYTYVVVNTGDKKLTRPLTEFLGAALGIYREYPDGIVVFKL